MPLESWDPLFFDVWGDRVSTFRQVFVVSYATMQRMLLGKLGGMETYYLAVQMIAGVQRLSLYKATVLLLTAGLKPAFA
ncbi:unnamed protein product [Periconia digitata]|uniref:Uncharacterized protein n=1 Tax=Periconia digitata TaxID=1303443 RepID=A0A9W4U6Q8_9PLEO|nr:unnamed protein product [Periconia digitata]